MDRGGPRASGIGDELVAAITAAMCDGDCSRLMLGAVLVTTLLLADICLVSHGPDAPSGILRSFAGSGSNVVRLVTLLRPTPANEAAA